MVNICLSLVLNSYWFILCIIPACMKIFGSWVFEVLKGNCWFSHLAGLFLYLVIYKQHVVSLPQIVKKKKILQNIRNFKLINTHFFLAVAIVYPLKCVMVEYNYHFYGDPCRFDTSAALSYTRGNMGCSQNWVFTRWFPPLLCVPSAVTWLSLLLAYAFPGPVCHGKPKVQESIFSVSSLPSKMISLFLPEISLT